VNNMWAVRLDWLYLGRVKQSDDGVESIFCRWKRKEVE
jgi:hypothetical protein